MIEIRTYDGDPEELAVFCTNVWRTRYGGQMPVWLWTGPFFNWELFSEEPGARDFLVTAYDGSRLIGAHPAKPVHYHWQGEPVFGTAGAYFSVDPEYQSQSVSLKLVLEQRRFHLHAAEAAHDVFLPWRRRGRTARLREQRSERLVRIGGEQAERAPRIGAHKVPKIRGGFGDGPEQVVGRRMILEQGFELLAGGAFAADCREPFGEAVAAPRRGERRRKIFANGGAGRA